MYVQELAGETVADLLIAGVLLFSLFCILHCYLLQTSSRKVIIEKIGTLQNKPVKTVQNKYHMLNYNADFLCY